MVCLNTSWCITNQLSNIRSENASLGNTNYSDLISVYGGITAANILLNFTRIIMIFMVAINASRVLHNRMFGAVMRVPILFFDFTTLGKTNHLI